jgi:hypothetical protein
MQSFLDAAAVVNRHSESLQQSQLVPLLYVLKGKIPRAMQQQLLFV